jgi:peptidyl-prolyl cis-trans isomerase C
MKRRSLAARLIIALPVALFGCNEAPLTQAPVDGGAPIAGLTADQAARTLAKVGDHAITLGDFAKALERMDQYDRLRYQSKERRRELLEEMIDVQLLAAEAKRIGLDKDPEAADQLRMILRDALLAQVREGLPTPAQISDQEVRAYFDAHADRFSEPERRRVAAIVMSDKKEAAKVLKEALKVSSIAEWGELFFKHSLTAPKTRGPTNAAELAGDLGIVGPMDDAKGGNPKVPDAVRAAAFKLKNVNEIDRELVEVEGRQFIVKLNGVTPAHKRAPTEADRAIRVLLIQEQMAEREQAIEEDLKKQFPIEIDEGALAAIKLPTGVDKADHPAGPGGEHEAPRPGASAGPDGRK